MLVAAIMAPSYSRRSSLERHSGAVKLWHYRRWNPMLQTKDDLSRSLVALERNRTLIAALASSMRDELRKLYK